MFTVVYVLVDDGSLYYYNELMKSITSLRMHMPKRKVSVIIDTETDALLRKIDAEVYEWAEVLVHAIDGDYSTVEKSRVLKLSVRQLIKGDLLYIDTDTVICDAFPDDISDSSVAMVLELNALRSIAKCEATNHYDKMAGIELNGFDYYFNSGVIWSKDDSFANEFYRNWLDLWEITRKRDTFRDQPSLNYLVKERISHIGVLDNEWNVQIATQTHSPLNYLTTAYIIHYMNNTWSPYQLCSSEIRQLEYNDPKVLELLKTPKSIFSRCRVLAIDDENHYCDRGLVEYEEIRTTVCYALMRKIYSKRPLFLALERFLCALHKAVKYVKR